MPSIKNSLLIGRWTRVPVRSAPEAAPPPAAPEPEVTPEEASYIFTAPAQGDGYKFTVNVWLWRRSATGSLVFRPWKELKEDKDHSIKDYVREIVRRSLRRHSIFEPAEAEETANADLLRWFDDRPTDSVTGKWRATVELDVPEEVKKLRRAHENELYKMDARAKEIDQHVQKLRASRAVCERFLSESMNSSTARHAVRLTQALDKVADITDEMLDERKEKVEELLELFAKIVDAQRHANAFELVMASETALRTAFRQLGVPLPPPDPDSPFALMEETR
ncbi:hypothetical protein ACQP2T_03395 [Nonomuraea sp. CA-143628]|uniref:hypothetical protein n=1 Tax=Nonomuraea sp. CA-143628 TaxID=3239997 RepID=UPI003D89BD1A